MIIYTPWSESVIRTCISSWKKGEVPTIDLELTARCSHGKCIYCDSGQYIGNAHDNEVELDTLLSFLDDAVQHGLKYVYSCGLGEPLDDPRFNEIIKFLKRKGVCTSIFTNGLKIDAETAKFLHDNDVSLILKLDSFKTTEFDELLGAEGTAEKIYGALDYLLDVGYACGENSASDLAFSIVPNKINLYSIERVIRFAKKHNIFPSIGELELSGRSTGELYDRLSLTSDEIKYLRNVVDENLWQHYKRPICPAILTSIHVDNLGRVIVDKKTGLSCKWFLLREPDIEILGDISDSVNDIIKKIADYRTKQFENPENLQHCCIDYEFGGCGGNPRDIIDMTKEMVGSRNSF